MKNEGNSPEVVEFLIRGVRAEMNTWCLPIGSWPLTLIFDGEQYKSKLGTLSWSTKKTSAEE